MASIQFGPADRDERGFVKVPAPAAEPRSLADLLPTPSAIQADAQRIQRQPPTKAEWAAMAALTLLVIGALGYLWATPAAPPRAPATAPATAQSGGESVLAPSPISATAPAVVAALIGYFDYASPSTAAAITAAQIERVIGRADGDWRLIQAGDARLWMHAGDIPARVPAADPLPDLTPRRAPLAPAAAPFIPAATEPPPPPPTQCAEAGISGKMVSSCGYDDLSVLQEQAKEKWLATYGGNPGLVTTPTPYGDTP